MAKPSLKSELWIKAQVRLCILQCRGAYIVVRGDPDAGAILVKLNKLDGTAQVLSQVFGIDGQRSWMISTGENPVAELDADLYISRQANRDPDIWVLEIEDPKGDYQLDAAPL
ncbi:MAG: hypothetical protein CMF70_00225 [Magnetovibrio sp.]|nr:hypothetical protein [Magnetovibrio sp.]|tara:strand:+ start:286 stop:624 length:339 start_codon:yes stop_codon:yes gene_type:complete